MSGRKSTVNSAAKAAHISAVRAAAGRLGGLAGGASRSAAKVAAARANGAKGGRPRKQPQSK